jgi:SNF2 family DNA or RNA helicase
LRELLVSPRLLGIDDDGAAIPFLIDRLEERGTPSMVATPFRAGVDWITQRVREAGWEVWPLVGGLSSSRTTEIWQGFQNSKVKKRIIVFTTQMGTAWTGTAAEQFYAVGYDWAPQINEQAEDRMNRYGGTGYECYYFTHFGTLDEHVLEVNAGKQTVENLIINHHLILDRGRM